MKLCQVCGKENPESNSYCVQCGSALRSDPPPPPAGCEACEEEVKSLRLQIGSKDEVIADLNKSIGSKDEEIANHKQAISDKSGEVASLTQTLSSKDKEIGSHKQALSDKSEEVASLTQTLGKKDEEIATHKQALSDIGEEVARLKQTLGGKVEEIVGHKQAVSEKHEELTSIKRNLSALPMEIRDRIAELVGIRIGEAPERPTEPTPTSSLAGLRVDSYPLEKPEYRLKGEDTKQSLDLAPTTFHIRATLEATSEGIDLVLQDGATVNIRMSEKQKWQKYTVGSRVRVATGMILYDPAATMNARLTLES